MYTKNAIFYDAIEQERSLPGWTQEYRQVSAGDYSGITSAIVYPNLTILRERINVRTEQMFSAPEGKLIFYYYYDRPNPASEVVSSKADATNTGFAWDWIDRVGFMHPNSDLLMVVLDPERLGEAKPQSGNLQGEIVERAKHVAEWLSSILHVLAWEEGLGNPHEELHTILPDLIQDRLSMLYQRGDLARDLKVAKAELIYRRLRDCMLEAPCELLTVSALSRELGIPASVLRKVCADFAATQLDHMLVQLRLNGAKRSLIEARGQDRRVCDIAMNWGFMHWSRFAARYRILFGETPSATLKRPVDHLAHA